ncbi:type II toxin-antitoxin system RelE/ParE family toxin [Lunatibacter salilacus]|uniref:type II toxin-antitoxin system RelE/ParE family toxin n=1 Tax=Lunatibacter salilacus TaxID=2483804 RepID=UPI00131B99B3|nr:type II toxin-antitoxin system RelE/ParE family toxin [Lunatibacter salilacus]
MRLEFSEEARLDIQETIDWYDSRKMGLGKEFLLSLDETINNLQNNPFQYPYQHNEVRRILLKRFPYQVMFVVANQNIGVLGVIHTSRNPTIWKKRAKG